MWRSGMVEGLSDAFMVLSVLCAGGREMCKGRNHRLGRFRNEFVTGQIDGI